MNDIIYNDIIDCSKSYKQIFHLNKKEDYYPFNNKRVANFIKTNHPDSIKTDDIDMATLLMLLRYRNCEIKIPFYESTTVSKNKKNEIIGDLDRHGEIIALKSNQYTFKFSVTIADKGYREKTIDNQLTDFCPRTYSITNDDGNFHHNWNNFKFDITDKEKEFLSKCLGDVNTVTCKKFVNSQLAQAFYSEYYRNIKVLIERLVAERKYLNDLKKQYLSKCNFINNEDITTLDNKSTVIKESAEQFESVKVLCFESRISNCPEEFNFNYIDTNDTPENIVNKCNDILDGIINLTGEYKFIARLIELAFFNVNKYKEDMSSKDFTTYNRCDCKWNEQKVKLPKARIEWFELMFKEYSILCRYFYKSIKQKINEGI